MLPILFCKPSPEKKILFRQTSSKGEISFRSLNAETDLDTIHDWVNRNYSIRFWQLNQSRPELKRSLVSVLINPHAHSFIALKDGKPIAQIDAYQIRADEIAAHLPEAGPHDCGIHVLMQPPRQSEKLLSLHTLRSFLAYYFSFEQAGNLFGEPDAANGLANMLARKAGFCFIKQIHLSYKVANLYSISPGQYLNQKKTNSNPPNLLFNATYTHP
jgi:hypothetical protein